MKTFMPENNTCGAITLVDTQNYNSEGIDIYRLVADHHLVVIVALREEGWIDWFVYILLQDVDVSICYV